MLKIVSRSSAQVDTSRHTRAFPENFVTRPSGLPCPCDTVPFFSSSCPSQVTERPGGHRSQTRQRERRGAKSRGYAPRHQLCRDFRGTSSEEFAPRASTAE